MKDVILWGAMGLWMGMAVQIAGFSGNMQLPGGQALRRSAAQRTMLYTLGLGMMLAALLCYLAVIDVDWIEVAPLHAGTMLGGVLFGMAVGLTAMSPATALTGLGGGRFWESLCGVLGCAAGAALGSMLPMEGVQALPPRAEGTLFRLTLRDGFALPGGFSALACLGLLLCTVALMIPLRRDGEEMAAIPEEEATPLEDVPRSEDEPLPEDMPFSEDEPLPEDMPFSEDELLPEDMPLSEDEPLPEDMPFSEDEPLPEDEALPPDEALFPEEAELPPGEKLLIEGESVSEETFVALLPEEEPMIIDTAEPDLEKEEASHDEQET